MCLSEQMTDNNNIENDLLQNPKLKENPFDVPEGYFLALEDSVRAKIHKPPAPFVSFAMKFKPALMLALTFVIIAGLGYGVASLTRRMTGKGEGEESIFALIEEGYIRNDFIDNYYEEIDPEKAFKDNIVVNDEIASYFYKPLSDEEILQLLEKE